MTPAYELADASKSYPVGDSAVAVLRPIRLTIPRGQFAAIVGPSGSGKSTLLTLLGGLDVPTAGTVSILGRSTSALSDADAAALRCRSIGFVFQSFHLLPAYDALSNVALPLVYGGAKDGRRRARRLLTDLGLGHRLHHRPATLSGGERQRAAFARAIANDPEILLADEPTGSLDQASGKAVMDLLAGFHARGRTVVLVTHSADLAARAQRVIEIVDGAVRSDRRGGMGT